MSHSLTLVHSFAVRSTENEAVAELDGSDFEDSEDDFDGYLDMKSNDEAYTNKRRTVLWRETKKELRKRMFLLEKT